jgi:aminoglycoside phosphotransferase (APT) family kinase protein
MDELAEVVAILEAQLGRAEGEPRPLEGGITNRNFKARFGGEYYVLRICGRETAVLGIDRAAELAATRAAHEAGVAPEVAAFVEDPQCLVTRFVPGRPVDAARLREPGTLAIVAAALRRVHEGPAFPVAFSPFRLVEDYRGHVLTRGGEVPPEYADAAVIAGRIERAMAGGEHAPVPCHNDLLTANFIDGGERLWIVDWEYAGMGDRFFDLGNMAVKNGFADADEERLLEAYLGVAPSEAQLAALRLMRLMASFWEAMWGTLQAVVSDLDFDYRGYAAEHFGHVHESAADPRLEGWIADAAAA